MSLALRGPRWARAPPEGAKNPSLAPGGRSCVLPPPSPTIKVPLRSDELCCAHMRGKVQGGWGQGLALIFIPAGGGDPSPLDPLPPSPGPPPPSAQVHPKTWGLGTFFSHGEKILAPSAHAIHYVHSAPCVLHLPCFPDYHAPTLVVSVFQLPGPTVATRKTRRRN